MINSISLPMYSVLISQNKEWTSSKKYLVDAINNDRKYECRDHNKSIKYMERNTGEV